MEIDRRALFDFSVTGRRGLEIGPLCTPRVLKNESDVFYLDHCSTEDLHRKYRNDPNTRLDSIVPIDFVADGRPLRDIIKSILPLDYVVAAHVIEHVPNIAGWLKEISECLSTDGILALWVPDKRFTFDLRRPISSQQEIEAAYIENRIRPGLRCVMDHFANVVRAECWHLWDDYRIARDCKFEHDVSFLTLAADDYRAGKHIDCHCWVFTPWSCLSLLGWMTKEFSIGFDLAFFETTPFHDLQFMIQLKRVDRSSTNWTAAAEKAFEISQRPQYWEEGARGLGLL